jgi:hypothetical protein
MVASLNFRPDFSASHKYQLLSRAASSKNIAAGLAIPLERNCVQAQSGRKRQDQGKRRWETREK